MLLDTVTMRLCHALISDMLTNACSELERLRSIVPKPTLATFIGTTLGLPLAMPRVRADGPIVVPKLIVLDNATKDCTSCDPHRC